jgi:hypothetical protein
MLMHLLAVSACLAGSHQTRSLAAKARKQRLRNIAVIHL